MGDGCLKQKNTMPRRIPDRTGGFTMIEMAFVLVIIGILLSMGAELIPMLIKQNKLNENRTIVKNTTSAVLGYCLATKSLPCADTDNDGVANNHEYRGTIPYVTLGIAQNDAHAHPLSYVVDRRLAESNPTDFLDDLNDLVGIAMPAGQANPQNLVICGTIKAAFAVYSSGEDMQLDSPNDTASNNRFASPDATVTSLYDDTLNAISAGDLYNRITSP